MSNFSNTFIFGLFAIFIILFFVFRNKKNKDFFLSHRKNKDEVWEVIKKFLKENNEIGKKIVDSYVVKKNNLDSFNNIYSEQARIKKKAEIEIRRSQNKKNNTKTKLQDLYVVVFLTQDLKTNQFDPIRCIEVEVLSVKIEKNYERKVVINKLLNYDEQLIWISPIREFEKAKLSAHTK